MINKNEVNLKIYAGGLDEDLAMKMFFLIFILLFMNDQTDAYIIDDLSNPNAVSYTHLRAHET